MMIKKIIIHNYKVFQDFKLDFDSDLNIIVGNNEAGKSTILEAINLALTRRINGRYLDNELSPHMLNKNTLHEYLDSLAKKPIELPNIFIEVYFDDFQDMAKFRGANNSTGEDAIGIRLEIAFDDNYIEEYEKLLKEKHEIKLIPTEYYKVSWKSFAESPIFFRNIPVNLSFIDATTFRLQSSTDYYLKQIINNSLDVKDQVAMNIAYRKLKEEFAAEESIVEINRKLDERKGEITEKEISLAIDVSQKSSWEANIIPHLADLPFQYSGGGEQSSIKIMLALEKRAEEANIVLIEEPENHLSFSRMNNLLKRIQDRAEGKQIIVSTHSSFVLNKLGLEKLILISSGTSIRLTNLKEDTQSYFKKLSGYDTLRLILADGAILVEGPSDELLVQKAYFDAHNNLPIQDGVDVINVRGLSFLRFLEIAKELKIKVSVVTDNDGDHEINIEHKYREYIGLPNVKICFDEDDGAPTLEPQILKANELKGLNAIFEKDFMDEKALLDYMGKNKTEFALRLFETEKPFEIPQYIQDAVRK